MQFTITLEQMYFGIFIFVSIMQIYLMRKIEKTKNEVYLQNKEIQKNNLFGVIQKNARPKRSKPRSQGI